MADAEHVAILSRGVVAWNRWRQDNPDTVPDLSGANIKTKKLDGINFRGADLGCAMLPGAKLKGANLEGASLVGTDLMEADLRGAWFSRANLERANLMGADLKNADLQGANLEGAILYRADLEGTECVCNSLWFEMLMGFAGRLIDAGESDGEYYFDDVAGSFVENSFVTTRSCRLELELSEPVSTGLVYRVLGALNRLYSAAASEELTGPIIQIGSPGAEDDTASP